MTLIDDIDTVRPWVMERTFDNFPMGVQAAIGVIRDGELVAGVLFDHYTGVCVTATIAIDGKYLPRKLLLAMFHYAYNQLKVGKIIVYINGVNHKSLRLAKQLGFTVEAEVANVYADGSMFILSLHKQDCAWI